MHNSTPYRHGQMWYKSMYWLVSIQRIQARQDSCKTHTNKHQSKWIKIDDTLKGKSGQNFEFWSIFQQTHTLWMHGKVIHLFFPTNQRTHLSAFSDVLHLLHMHMQRKINCLMISTNIPFRSEQKQARRALCEKIKTTFPSEMKTTFLPHSNWQPVLENHA